MKNPGSNYVQRNTSSPHKPHNIKHEQINELFRAVGWIGRLRHSLRHLKIIRQTNQGSPRELN